MRTKASIVKIKILITLCCSEGKQENVDAHTPNVPFLLPFIHFTILEDLYQNLPLQLI